MTLNCQASLLEGWISKSARVFLAQWTDIEICPYGSHQSVVQDLEILNCSGSDEPELLAANLVSFDRKREGLAILRASLSAGLCWKCAHLSCHFHDDRKSLKSRFAFESLRDGRVGVFYVDPQRVRIRDAPEAYTDETHWKSNQHLRWLPR